MSASLMKRAALQEKLAENFEQEADRLREELEDFFGEFSQSSQHDLEAIQKTSIYDSPDAARKLIKERFNLDDPTLSQVHTNIEQLNHADHEGVNMHMGLQTTNHRRKQRRRQKQ